MQKIWLWIFGAMFVVPEVLWSPVSNLCYELLNNTGTPYRVNFLTNSDNMAWLAWVLLFQLIGISFFAILTWKNFKTNHYNLIAAIFSTLLALVTLFLFYLSITLGVHGIG